MSDDQTDLAAARETAGPLPNRFTRGTLVGCFGILCVLAMPALLFLPIETWNVPLWLALLVPLIAFGAVAFGVWLLGRMPAARVARAADPLRPVTGAGQTPLLERPATRSNRLVATGALALGLCGALGFVVAGFATPRPRSLLIGLALVAAVGLALTLVGVAVSTDRLAPPAWRWVRAPIRGTPTNSGVPLALAGLAALLWALVVAAGNGYWWGAAGVSALVIGGVLAAPLARRWPRSGR